MNVTNYLQLASYDVANLLVSKPLIRHRLFNDAKYTVVMYGVDQCDDKVLQSRHRCEPIY